MLKFHLQLSDISANFHLIFTIKLELYRLDYINIYIYSLGRHLLEVLSTCGSGDR